jgi:hypothetical protein
MGIIKIAETIGNKGARCRDAKFRVSTLTADCYKCDRVMDIAVYSNLLAKKPGKNRC